eukprot:scaffold20823_cov27-Tisochrysis_lutea.AAC.1
MTGMARASLMHAVDLVVAMHLLIEYMFLQGAEALTAGLQSTHLTAVASAALFRSQMIGYRGIGPRCRALQITSD